MKISHRVAFALGILVGLVATSVYAKGVEKVTYDKKTHLDFEEKSVDGEFLRPDSQAVSADKNTDFDSLLGARNNFKRELKRSSGAIR